MEVRKRVGLGTYLRLRGFRRQRTRSGQLKEDTQSAYVRRFLRGEIINIPLFLTRTHLAKFAKICERSDTKDHRPKDASILWYVFCP